METSEPAGALSKTQELVYDLTVDKVMTRRVLSVAPLTPMSQLRTILRDNRISGTPVLDDGGPAEQVAADPV